MGKFLKLKLVRSQNWNKIENFLIFYKIMAVLSGFLDVRSTNWATLLLRELSNNCQKIAVTGRSWVRIPAGALKTALVYKDVLGGKMLKNNKNVLDYY